MPLEFCTVKFCCEIKRSVDIRVLEDNYINRVANNLGSDEDGQIEIPSVMEFEGTWPKDVKRKLLDDMTVIENFISAEDETALLAEIEPYLKRMRYERDHWDDAIQGFRETERKSWYPQNKEIIKRIISRAFPNADSALPHIHVLDLEATGS